MPHIHVFVCVFFPVHKHEYIWYTQTYHKNAALHTVNASQEVRLNGTIYIKVVFLLLLLFLLETCVHFSLHYLSFRFAGASESLLAYFIYLCACMCAIFVCAGIGVGVGDGAGTILPALLCVCVCVCCHLKEKQSAISLNVYAFAIRILFVYLLFGGCAGVVWCGMERIMFMG